MCSDSTEKGKQGEMAPGGQEAAAGENKPWGKAEKEKGAGHKAEKESIKATKET